MMIRLLCFVVFMKNKHVYTARSCYDACGDTVKVNSAEQITGILCSGEVQSILLIVSQEFNYRLAKNGYMSSFIKNGRYSLLL